MKYSILIVDDEPGIRQSLTGVLQHEGYRAEAVASGEQCLEFRAKKKCDVVLLDIWLPAIDFLHTPEQIQAIEDPAPFVMGSCHATMETAIPASKMRAFV